MRHLIKLFSIVLLLIPLLSIGQSFTIQTSNSSLKVLGTSSLHDWHEAAEDYSGTIEFSNLESLDISKLTLNVVAEGLKSGKGAMDKITYKTLKTKEYKNITFKLSEVVSSQKNSTGSYTVDTKGVLTISGVSKNVNVQFKLSKESESIKLTGSKSIKMTDFNLDPPTALLGTIKTGDDIAIEYNLIFK